MMDVNEVNLQIGRKVKNLRQYNGLTQQELADRTELSKGFISQLEHGQVSPSVVTLMDLIECLGTTASEFFREEAPRVVFEPQHFFEKIDEEGNRVRWIIPNAQKNEMEPLLVELQPGTTLKEDKPHSGEEFGYVLKGRVRLDLGEEEFEAGEGSGFYYNADRKHRVSNPFGEQAEIIWISTPPNF